MKKVNWDRYRDQIVTIVLVTQCVSFLLKIWHTDD